MQKVTISLLFALLMCSILAGCGDKDESDNVSVQQAQIKVENNTSDQASNKDDELGLDQINAIGDVEVDKGLFNVEFTVPKDLMGDATQEELEKEAKEKGYKSITLNPDGSATYKMSKSQHEELMEETKRDFEKSLAEMTGPSSDYPNFVEIKPNDDYTSFTVVTKGDSLKLDESMSVIALYMYGGMYNIFNGTPADNIHVDFVNEASGQVIQSADSKDMGN